MLVFFVYFFNNNRFKNYEKPIIFLVFISDCEYLLQNKNPYIYHIIHSKTKHIA